jgi:hypothetical protein
MRNIANDNANKSKLKGHPFFVKIKFEFINIWDIAPMLRDDVHKRAGLAMTSI